MSRRFSRKIYADKQSYFVAVLQEMRPDGPYYEINIPGYSRFYMNWSEMGRYDITEPDSSIPYNLVLAVSDFLEREKGSR